MDNAQKAIIIGVGLFITIIVIAAVMLITGIGQDLLNGGQKQLGGVTSNINDEDYKFYEYNNKEMSGRRVLAAIKKFKEDPAVQLIGIQNYNDSNLYTTSSAPYMFWATNKAIYYNYSYWKCYNRNGEEKNFNGMDVDSCVYMRCSRVADTSATSIDSLSNRSDGVHYINPSKKYKSVVIKDKDEKVIGVYFFLIS